MLLIGSRAARHAYGDARTPKDWDLMASREELLHLIERPDHPLVSLVPQRPGKHLGVTHGGVRLEIEETGGVASCLILDALPGLPLAATPLGPARVVPPAYLAGLKRSHLQWPVHWDKSICDLHWLRSRLGGDERRDPGVAAFVRIRQAEHAARFGARQAKLAVSNDEFFARSQKQVGRVHDHDFLHALVAYDGRPMFERFKRDLSQASLARDMFEAAPRIDQLRLVREEAMVIALERRILPNEPGSVDAGAAYAWALKRICTTLTSGWFRSFAIDTWPETAVPDRDFVGMVQDALRQDAVPGRC